MTVDHNTGAVILNNQGTYQSNSVPGGVQLPYVQNNGGNGGYVPTPGNGGGIGYGQFAAWGHPPSSGGFGSGLM